MENLFDEGKDARVTERKIRTVERIIESIDEMKEQFNFVPSNSYSDALMNLYYNNCIFLDDYTGRILAESKATMECVLYSEYYWGHCFIKRAKELMYTDAGFEQWHYKIIEKMEHSGMEIDYALLERIDSNIEPLITPNGRDTKTRW